MSAAGSIKGISINGRPFQVAADADLKKNLGGYENEIELNGNGSVRVVKTRVGWSVTGLTISISDQRRDQQFLQDVKNGLDDENVITITQVDDTVYRGKGTITDKLECSTKNQTAELSLGGPGELEQQ